MKGTQHKKSLKIIAVTLNCSFLFLLTIALSTDSVKVLADLLVLMLIIMYETEMTITQRKFIRRTDTVNHFCGSVCVTKYLNTHTPELP